MNPFRSSKGEAHSNQPESGSSEAAAAASAAPVDPDQTQALIDSLRSELAAVNGELTKALTDRDELQHRTTLLLAEMSNAARRARQSEEQAKEMGVRSVLLNVLPVIDHFDYALNQDPAKVTAQSVISGMTMIKEELIKALAGQGATAVKPDKGEAFDPLKHEAVTQQAAEGVASGHVVQTLRIGFAINGRMIRPAQVIVAP